MFKYPKALVFFFCCSIQPLMADTGIFHKVSVLRFGHERVIELDGGRADFSKLADNEYFHVKGFIPFIPGEFIQTSYLDSEAFSDLLSEKNALDSLLRAKTYTFPTEGSDFTYGSFVARLENLPNTRIAIVIPRFYHAIDLYLVDQSGARRVLSYGDLDKNPANNKNFGVMAPTIPVVEAGGDLLLVAHVSGPQIDGRNTINFSSFYVGYEPYLQKLNRTTLVLASLISGGFLLMFIFYSFIYVFRPKDLTSLYLSVYALFCFVLSILYTWGFDLTPHQVIDYFTIVNVFSICALQFFLLEKIRFRFSNRFIHIAMASCFAIAGVCAFAILNGLKELMGLAFILSFLSSNLIVVATLYLGFKYKLEGIFYFLLASVVNSVFQFPIMMTTILNTNEENGFNILMADFFMALGLALVNAKEFAVTYQKSLQQSIDLEEKNKEITFFNKNLEKMVDDKTKEIRSLLDHIPQGVLSLTTMGMVEKDYSAHLESILGDSEIAERSFMDLILSRCNMSPDEKDQLWQSLISIIGEDELNYEANSDKLPGELIYSLPEGEERFLKATWNIQLDDDDQVVRLLVTLLDVTSEKEFERQAEEQRKDLELIEQLLNIQASKVAQFFATAIPLLEESQRIINSAETSIDDEESLKILFVNAHTVKGAARTLQFKNLASVIHTMEESYASILREKMELPLSRLKEELAQTMQMLGRYRKINSEKLSRSEDNSSVTIDRSFIENHYFLIKDLLNGGEKVDLSQLMQTLKEESVALTQLIFEQLPSVFDHYAELAKKIARDIGKKEPICEFDICEISVSPQLKTTLDNCMVHLLRNSLDHGIEFPEDRLRKSKPEQGTLSICASSDEHYLSLSLRDDGQGLAVAKLREKGMQLGLFDEDASLDQVARVIFSSGVSTAQKLSDISGRGVGMSAVESFIENLGGSIDIVLEEAKAEDPSFYSFHFDIKLPLNLSNLSDSLAESA